MNTEDMLKKWDEFDEIVIDPWARKDGVRLMVTGSGYGIRENGEGRLVPVTDSDVLVGRDEYRAKLIVLDEVRRQTKLLKSRMRVPRSAVLGKGATIPTSSTSSKHCECRLDGNTVRKPEQPFVTYITQKGLVRYRAIKE